MPSPIAHSIISFSFYRWYADRLPVKFSRIHNLFLILYFSILSIIFDFDFFKFENFRLHISFANHTRNSHSILWATIFFSIIFIIIILFKKNIFNFKLLIKLSFITLTSHIILDLLCWDKNYSNGIGSPLFYPLSKSCYISDIIFFVGLDRKNILSFYNLAVIYNEFIISILTAFLIIKISIFLQKKTLSVQIRNKPNII